MKRVLLVAFLIAGCNPDTLTKGPPSPAHQVDLTSDVLRVHDSEAQVTCWYITGGYGKAISCLPDKAFSGSIK